MKQNYSIYTFLFILTIIFLTTGCEDSITDPVGDNTAVVRGSVANTQGEVIVGADMIAMSTAFGSISTTSDAEGRYEFVLPVSVGESTTNYTLSASKPTYNPKSETIPLASSNVVVVNFVLSQTREEDDDDDDTEPPSESRSGPASNLIVYEVQSSSIGVTGGGYDETSRIVFQARDANGVPVDTAHAVNVVFTILGGPGGGEFLSPASGRTDEDGQVVVTLNAGIRAGVVQVAAEATVGGRTIRSTPVKLSIHGGLPAQEHFGLAPERLNFPALHIVNARLGIVAVLGDKFSNPVRPGTNVYFRTNAGNIQTEVSTDNDGVAPVQLISLGKNINATVHGPGFGYVTAETRGENGVLVTDSVLVLLSGSPIITVDPFSFEIPNNGSQSFNFTVADYNGNPMAEGQKITVNLELPQLAGTAKAPELILTGITDFTLPDTQSRSFTNYGFTLSVYGGDEDDVIENMPVTVRILTTGSNGNVQLNFSGTVNVN
jgi:hypothetical protein